VQIPNEIMPIALVRSISLPNLKVYTTISLLLVSGCLYYAFDVVRTDPQWKLHQNTSYHSSTRPSSLLKSSNDALAVLTNSDLLSSLTSSLTSSESEEKEPQESIFEETTGNVNGSSFTHQLKDVLSFMTHEPVCIWVSRSHFSLISDCFGVADKICFRKRQSQPAFDTLSDWGTRSFSPAFPPSQSSQLSSKVAENVSTFATIFPVTDQLNEIVFRLIFSSTFNRAFDNLLFLVCVV
jgi:hypothetical protein